MAIIVNDVPTIANAGSNQTLCISSPNTIMSANTSTVGTGVWTLISGSGTITSPNNPSTTITGLAIGTNIFQWTIFVPIANPVIVVEGLFGEVIVPLQIGRAHV